MDINGRDARGKSMEKLLKIAVMLLVVAAVVAAAGCAENKTTNVTQGDKEQVTPGTSVASEGVNQTEAKASVPPAEEIVAEDNTSAVNETNVSETNVSAATASVTQTSTTGHVSITKMKRDKIRQNLGLDSNNTT